MLGSMWIIVLAISFVLFVAAIIYTSILLHRSSRSSDNNAVNNIEKRGHSAAPSRLPWPVARGVMILALTVAAANVIMIPLNFCQLGPRIALVVFFYATIFLQLVYFTTFIAMLLVLATGLGARVLGPRAAAAVTWIGRVLVVLITVFGIVRWAIDTAALARNLDYHLFSVNWNLMNVLAALYAISGIFFLVVLGTCFVKTRRSAPDRNALRFLVPLWVLFLLWFILEQIVDWQALYLDIYDSIVTTERTQSAWIFVDSLAVPPILFLAVAGVSSLHGAAYD